MTDAPETIWVQFGRRGELIASNEPEQRPIPEISDAFCQYIRADLPPKVKPLEWTVFDAWTMWVETSIDKWSIDDIGKDGEEGCVLFKKNGQIVRYFDEDGNDWGMWPSIEAAKAAAQADYERRILSALDV